MIMHATFISNVRSGCYEGSVMVGGNGNIMKQCAAGSAKRANLAKPGCTISLICCCCKNKYHLDWSTCAKMTSKIAKTLWWTRHAMLRQRKLTHREYLGFICRESHLSSSTKLIIIRLKNYFSPITTFWTLKYSSNYWTSVANFEHFCVLDNILGNYISIKNNRLLFWRMQIQEPWQQLENGSTQKTKSSLFFRTPIKIASRP